MPKIIKPVAKGTFTVASISVDSQGRIVTAASGSAGGALDVMSVAQGSSGNGNYVANPAANNATIYACGGGGGGGRGGPSSDRRGGNGGTGGFGAFFVPVSGGTTYAFTVGGGGSGAPAGSPSNGSAGQATTVPGLSVTANAGNGGQRGYFMVQNPGNTGSAPGATNTITTGDVAPFFQDAGKGGTGPAGGPNAGAGSSGNSGFLIAYDNVGE
tara:strand:+ start:192 stop:830 length:639 start_codon:yes stop_codon:yes gene_type:complete